MRTGRGLGSKLTAAAGLAAGAAVWRSRQQSDLSGQVALVAGASRGLGLLIARELARRGCRVAICARGSAELDRAQALLAEEGHRVETFVCDVTDRGQVRELVDRVGTRLGEVEILITVAGIIQVGPEASMRDEDFERAMDVMHWGPFHLTRAVLPSMRRRGAGRVATVTSIGGKVSVPHLLPYSAAKFAAVGFMEGLRAELAGTGVTATTIVPGPMRTGSHLQATFTGQHEREYAWFALHASAPLVATDAERAARQIVDGVAAGRGVVQLTPLTHVVTRVHGLAPGTTTALLGVMGRLLPAAPATTDTEGVAQRPGVPHLMKGHEADERLNSRVLRALTGLGRDAANRFNERTVPVDQD